MHPIIETKRREVAEICRRQGVRRLEVIGSAARDDFDESQSDIDFLVHLSDDPQDNLLDAYFGLKDALEAMFGRSVDLVSIGSVINPYVKASIERDRQLVFAA